MLHVRRFGSGPSVVALHGFSLTGEAYVNTADALGRTIIAPDLPGHGRSRMHPSSVDSVTSAVDGLLDSLGGPLPLMGYSQGGRIALLTTIGDHTNVSALVLVSASPGIRDPQVREARLERDHALADRIRDVGVDAFIDSWTSSGITAIGHLDDTYRAWDRSVRSENTADGLMAALRDYGQGAQPSVWDELGNLTMPVLLVTGSGDDYYTSTNAEMQELIPNAEHIVVDDAGHNPIADQPETTLGAISGFLDRNG